MCRLIGQKLLVETPAAHASPDMQAYIQQELNRPCKRWVVDVLSGAREASEVRLRTGEFVLLPDTERVNRYGRALAAAVEASQNKAQARDQWGSVRARLLWGGRRLLPAPAPRHRSPLGICMRQTRCYNAYNMNKPWFCQEKEEPDQALEPATGEQEPAPPPATEQVNWLAIATEPGLRSLRDLRGRHVPMLRRMLALSKSKIQAETGVPAEEIMAYVHYPPSVYQLHVHFAYPYAQYNHRDVFRIHSLANVITNLEIDPDYYRKACLQVSLPKNSVLHQICGPDTPEPTCNVRTDEGLERRKSI